MAGAGIRMYNHMIRRGAEHYRNFTAKRLRILVMRIDVHRPIRFDVGDGHGWADRCVLHVRQLICGGKLLVSRRQRRARIAFISIAL